MPVRTRGQAALCAVMVFRRQHRETGIFAGARTKGATPRGDEFHADAPGAIILSFSTAAGRYYRTDYTAVRLTAGGASTRRFGTWQPRDGALSRRRRWKRKSFAPLLGGKSRAKLGRLSRECPADLKCAFGNCGRRLRRRNEEGARFSDQCGITIALTYPLIFRWDGASNDAGDPALNTWILWWNTEAVPFSARWWDAPAFFPAPGVLSFSENLLGLSLVSTPLHWLGAGPQTAYNVVFLLTFPLSALGAYLLGYELTKRHDAAFLAGLLFGFAPYRIAHLPQIQALASFPMPFALLGLHRYLGPRGAWLALFARGGSQAFEGYTSVFSVFVGRWICVRDRGRDA